jgi:LytS/YehU family sensor histidine kinase
VTDTVTGILACTLAGVVAGAVSCTVVDMLAGTLAGILACTLAGVVAGAVSCTVVDMLAGTLAGILVRIVDGRVAARYRSSIRIARLNPTERVDVRVPVQWPVYVPSHATKFSVIRRPL